MNHERAYTILGVPPGSSPTVIKKMYYKKALLCHPDKGGDAAEFQALHEAYEYVSEEKDLLPFLFQASFEKIISTLDRAVVKDIYMILVEMDIPESILLLIKKYITLFIIYPTIHDLVQQKLFIFEHQNQKYLVPTWHHELNFETFDIYCKPTLEPSMTLDENNDLHITVHADIQNVFKHGLHVPCIDIIVPGEHLKIIDFQRYTLQGTIPRINTLSIYNVSHCANYILDIFLH